MSIADYLGKRLTVSPVQNREYVWELSADDLLKLAQNILLETYVLFPEEVAEMEAAYVSGGGARVRLVVRERKKRT